MKWIKVGTLYGREYYAVGERGDYLIDLDMPADRWALFLNGQRIVENIYDVRDTQRIAARYDLSGTFNFEADEQLRTDSGRARNLVGASSFATAVTANVAPVITNTVFESTAGSTNIGDAQATATKIAALVIEKRIAIDNQSVDWSPWSSGLYCVLDTVFSAQARYESVVVPLLRRLNTRSCVSDTSTRAFSDFIRDVDVIGDNKFEAYAATMLNRQRVGGRLKVAVAYDAARFFSARSIETMADLRSNKATLQRLVLGDFQTQVVGIGPALANYFLALIGNEDRIKLDVMLLRFWGRLDVPRINPGNPEDYAYATHVFTLAAQQLSTSPARLDKAIWDYESKLKPI